MGGGNGAFTRAAGVAAFVVTIVLLLSDRHRVSVDAGSGGDAALLRSQLAAATSEATGLRRSLTNQLDAALQARRDLRLSDATCATACRMSNKLSHNAHLRSKLELQTCHGMERSRICCHCLDEGYVIAAAGGGETPPGDALETAQEAVADSLAAIVVDRVAEQAAEAKARLAPQLGGAGGSGDGGPVEVDDLDAATFPVTCQAPVPQQIFYNRIGKAGSTTVMGALKSASRSNGYQVKELLTDEYLTKEGGLEVMQKYVGAGLGCVTSKCSRTVFIGHVFYMDLADYIPEDRFTRPAYIEWLRDPVERYISQYYFWRTLGDIGPSTSQVGATLEQCAARSHRYGCPPLNYMTSYLCGNADVCHDPPDEQTFLRAKRNLLTQYAMVGLTEEMSASMRLLQKTLPTWFKAPPPAGGSANANRKKKAVAAATKALVEAANSFDRRLYEVAHTLFKRRMQACGL